jgi:hypothetical protein
MDHEILELQGIAWTENAGDWAIVVLTTLSE